ncbi:hypothetical protein FIBSPDRAFT_928216 [Athelia psychrophila]|uniref:Uncharacterized protein n=1 Tax=Athelia psychrophila TaxID=1759441 RepID=A0A166QQN4_9AGAM|nr:hypothetical protein FIBSPDRAFT_928216 [Fibularhizoctonia sp. CBS 109695]
MALNSGEILTQPPQGSQELALKNLSVSWGAGGFSLAGGLFRREFGVLTEVAFLGVSLYVLGLALGPMLLALLSEVLVASHRYWPRSLRIVVKEMSLTEERHTIQTILQRSGASPVELIIIIDDFGVTGSF